MVIVNFKCMRRIEEHRDLGSVNGKWLEPDPVNGPEEVCYDEMVRRTLERQTGESFPKDSFAKQVKYDYRFLPDDKKALSMDKVPGTVLIRYSRIK